MLIFVVTRSCLPSLTEVFVHYFIIRSQGSTAFKRNVIWGLDLFVRDLSCPAFVVLSKSCLEGSLSTAYCVVFGHFFNHGFFFSVGVYSTLAPLGLASNDSLIFSWVLSLFSRWDRLGRTKGISGFFCKRSLEVVRPVRSIQRTSCCSSWTRCHLPGGWTHSVGRWISGTIWWCVQRLERARGEDNQQGDKSCWSGVVACLQLLCVPLTGRVGSGILPKQCVKPPSCQLAASVQVSAHTGPYLVRGAWIVEGRKVVSGFGNT